MFGLSSAELKYIIKTVVQPLEEKGYRVYCFGSRARGDFKRFSDLDLLIEGQENRPSLGEIEEKLINENFPYKIDLVFKGDVAESYREKIEKEKVLVSPR